MKRTVLFILAALLLIAGTFFGVRFFLSQPRGESAGLKVTSTPTASIFLDGKNIGRTPYEDKLEPGEYTIKLIPEITSGQTVSWQGKITLRPNLLTFVNRELGTTDLASGGEVLSLEKSSGNETELAVFSTPEGATIELDGQDQGTAPLSLKNIKTGDHELVVSSAGFQDRPLKIRSTAGYKLIADIQLALAGLGATKDTDATSTTEPTGTAKTTGTQAKPTGAAGASSVTILDTPTGFLRVRVEPSTSASESGRVEPGETFPLIEEQSGWYKIEYEAKKEGWISNRYAEKTE